MSYEKAMKWGKKHPKGIRNLALGFDAFTTKQQSQSTLARESGATSFYVTSRQTVHDQEQKHSEIFATEDEAIDFIRKPGPNEELCWRVYNNLDWHVSGW